MLAKAKDAAHANNSSCAHHRQEDVGCLLFGGLCVSCVSVCQATFENCDRQTRKQVLRQTFTKENTWRKKASRGTLTLHARFVGLLAKTYSSRNRTRKKNSLRTARDEARGGKGKRYHKKKHMLDFFLFAAAAGVSSVP